MPKAQRQSRAAREDRREREVYGRFGSAYRHLLGDRPQCRVGDPAAARNYLAKIEAVIEHGGWTPAEADRLYRMRKIWRGRAAGTDARWNLWGNRPGRLPGETPGPLPSARAALREMRKLVWREQRKIEARRRLRHDEQREGDGV